MEFSCQACGQHPLPALQTWQEQIHKGLKAFHNVYTTESQPFYYITDGLVEYIETLKKEQEAATKVLKSALSFLAPMSKVSDDVLVCVFRHLFSSDNNDDQPIKSSRVQPYTLVCKRWRSIIISTSQFWTCFSLPPVQGVPPTTTTVRRYFSLFSERAGIFPISLDADSLSTLMLSDVDPAILDRISSLHIKPTAEAAEATFASCSLFPNLTQLSCHYTPYMASSSGPHITINLPESSAPRLTTFILDVSYNMDKIILPWANIVKLEIYLRQGLDSHPCTLLTQLESIEELDLVLGFDTVHSPIPGALNITLPRLRILVLTHLAPYDDIPFQFLEEANFPSLEDLRFSLYLWDGYGRLAGVLVAAPDRWSRIVRLKLEFETDFEDSEEEVEKVLDSLWVFKGLEAFHCRVDGNFLISARIFEGLCMDDPSEILFPQLKLLELTEVNLDEVDFEEEVFTALRTMLKRRSEFFDGLGGTATETLMEVLLSDPVAGVRLENFCGEKRHSRSFTYNEGTCVTIVSKRKLPDEFLDRLQDVSDDDDGVSESGGDDSDIE